MRILFFSVSWGRLARGKNELEVILHESTPESRTIQRFDARDIEIDQAPFADPRML
jgi:hypothetical protein